MASFSRALMRYHGGKFRLAPWIIAHLPPHRVYTEAYGGAASVLLRKPRSAAEVYNDLDQEIVNLFQVLRNPIQATQLRHQLMLTPYSRTEFNGAYEPVVDPVEQARRTMIKAQQGFGSNGVHRQTGWRIYVGSNRGGQTLPAEWQTLPAMLDAVVARMQGVYIENRPALDVLTRFDSPETAHYVDPPYVHSTRSLIVDEYHTGYKYELDDEQHCALAETLHQLRGMVILSGYACPLYAELFGDWLRIDKATNADGARPRTESLWLNPAAQRARQAPTLFEFAEARP